MSFNNQKSRALDENYHMGGRAIYVYQCIENVSNLINVITFSEILEYYKNKNMVLPINDLLDIEIIVNELSELRDTTIALIKKYELHRKEQKIKGIRIQPNKDEYSDIIHEAIKSLWKKFKM